MGNEAIEVNPPNATIAITRPGSSFNWAWFSFFAAILLGLILSLFAVRRTQRTFHRIAVILLFIWSIAYFLMASDLGATPIPVEFRADTPRQAFRSSDGVPTRQIWYVRWVAYALIWPVLVYLLLLATARPVSEYVVASFWALSYAVLLLIGGLIRSSYKWGLFAFALFAMFCAMYELLVPGTRSARRIGTTDDYLSPYLVPVAIFCVLWPLYSVAWALTSGANVVRPNSEMFWLGVLDLTVVTLVLLVFLTLVNSVDHDEYIAHRWGEESVPWEKSGRRRDSTSAAGRNSTEATSASSTGVRASDHARARQTAAGAPVQPTHQSQPVAVPVGPVAPSLETTGQQAHTTTAH